MVASKLDNKQLDIIYQVEHGCLGSQGDTLIEAFCTFATKKLNAKDSNNFNYSIQSRLNIHQHHIHYQINNKRLNREQIIQLLALIQIDIQHFEDQLDEQIVEIIEEFLGRTQ